MVLPCLLGSALLKEVASFVENTACRSLVDHSVFLIFLLAGVRTGCVGGRRVDDLRQAHVR